MYLYSLYFCRNHHFCMIWFNALYVAYLFVVKKKQRKKWQKSVNKSYAIFIFCFLSPAPAKRGIWKCRQSVRPRYVVSALRFLFVDQLISNLHTSIILGISSLSSKLGKIRNKIVGMAAIFKMSAKTHQNFYKSATISTKIDIQKIFDLRNVIVTNAI